MSNKLLIVESPGKIKTLSKFLGKDYTVEASVGHVVDLPPSRFGVSVKDGYVPAFHVVKDRKDVILRLQKAAKKADKIYLAPDPDREGEAISWHLATLLDIDPASDCRITFNSITKDNVLASLENPRPINYALVNAQQSRRILDRLVGYKLSPLLWSKICLGLSAGRVQSVAVMLICRREKEIMAFVPEEYWHVDLELKTNKKEPFILRLAKENGKKSEVTNAKQAEAIAAKVKDANITITDLTENLRPQNPPPPFITSTLQAEAAARFGYAPKRTMSIAQKLYEGIEIGSEGQTGLITYMRTDSVRISPEGLKDIRDFIATSYDKKYSTSKPRDFSTKKGAQDAHEAIRPTLPSRTPAALAPFLKKDQHNIYTLIWNRAVASQMAEALNKVVTLEADIDGLVFRAKGSTNVFDGYTKLYKTKNEDGDTDSVDKQTLPLLKKGDKVTLKNIKKTQNFTTPPPRYTEASIIRTMEKEGIGRPSTYASIVDTIQQRKYVKKEEGKFVPSDTAFLVNEVLETYFPDLISLDFTAKMEKHLDMVEEEELDWVKLLDDFYKPFEAELEKAENNLEKVQIPTDVICPECESIMLARMGKTGKFLACSNYPDCKSTINIPDTLVMFANGIPEGPIHLADKISETEETEEPELLDEVCDKCGSPMQVKTGRFGKFIACSNYPACKNTKPILKEVGVNCPAKGCNGKIVEKRSKTGRLFYGCSNYPDCTITTWSLPTGKLCPLCSEPLVWHTTKKLGKHIKCSDKKCKYKEESQDK